MKQTRPSGYTYEADLHCVDCALARHHNKPFALNLRATVTMPGNDANGLPYAAEDSEGNLIHPVFSISEMPDNHCRDCGAEIDVHVVVEHP